MRDLKRWHQQLMQLNKHTHLLAVIFSLTLHALVFMLASNKQFGFINNPAKPKAEATVIFLALLPPPPEKSALEPGHPAPTIKAAPAIAPAIQRPQEEPVAPPAAQRQLASLAAPPAPTAQEWEFAAKYTLKNSKGYRHTWAQQVRSQMGTAVEGPDQGLVRFRLEIAPDGTLTKLETLWTTSTVAEQLARKAIENMPPSRPTPTGRPLIFEKTISFSPFASDGTPTYKDDCLPDPPAFRNPFAWDGTSPQVRVESKPVEKPDPQALEECVKQLPQDTIKAESAHDQRLLDQWGSNKTGQ